MKTIKITGKIALSQLWPQGKSDADSTNLKLTVINFEFSTNGHTFHPTTAYNNSSVGDSSVIKYEGQTRQYIKIRLQGIDATELHYRIYDPKAIKANNSNPLFKQFNKDDYRQHMSESATVALGTHLAQFADANGDVECVFISQNLNEPKDVLDVYGRFVGDIFIKQNNENINQWLLKENWVMPAYYNSMLPNEITTLDAFYLQAIGKHRLSKFYTNKIDAAHFDFNLKFRDPKTNPAPIPNPVADEGSMILPKMYRRLCVYSIKRKAKIENITFESSLRATDDKDKLMFLNDFLQNGENAPKVSLSNIYTNDKLELHGNEVKPNSIVFVEKNDNKKLIKKDTKVVITQF